MSNETNLLGAAEETNRTPASGHNASKSLLKYIERIENLEVEKKGLAEDIKAVKQEAVANGFDKKMIQEMLKLRDMDKEKLREREYLRDSYIDALDLL